MSSTFPIRWCFLVTAVFTALHSCAQTEGLETTFNCGVRQDSRILLSQWDGGLYVYQHHQNHGMVYMLDISGHQLDSVTLSFPQVSEVFFHDPTAFDVREGNALLCFGNQVFCYLITANGWELHRTIEIPDGEVIFQAGWDSFDLVISSQRPDLGQYHTLSRYSGQDVKTREDIKHPLVFLSTFAPSQYFDQQGGKMYFLDNAHFVVYCWNDSMKQVTDLSPHLDTTITPFLLSLEGHSVREQSALFMDRFGQHEFDLVTDLYVDDSAIHLLYFPASTKDERLKRTYLRIPKKGKNVLYYPLVEGNASGLLGFKALAVAGILYWIRAEDGLIRLGTFPTS